MFVFGRDTIVFSIGPFLTTVLCAVRAVYLTICQRVFFCSYRFWRNFPISQIVLSFSSVCCCCCCWLLLLLLLWALLLSSTYVRTRCCCCCRPILISFVDITAQPAAVSSFVVVIFGLSKGEDRVASRQREGVVRGGRRCPPSARVSCVRGRETGGREGEKAAAQAERGVTFLFQ